MLGCQIIVTQTKRPVSEPVLRQLVEQIRLGNEQHLIVGRDAGQFGDQPEDVRPRPAHPRGGRVDQEAHVTLSPISASMVSKRLAQLWRAASEFAVRPVEFAFGELWAPA